MAAIDEKSFISGPLVASPDLTAEIHRLFEQSLAKHGNQLGETAAVLDDMGRLTFNELNALANRVARCMSSAINSSPQATNADGDYLIAICGPPSKQVVVALLAILKAGAGYLPLDPTFPSRRLAYILNEAKPALVLSCQGPHDTLVEARAMLEYEPIMWELDDIQLEANADNLNEERMLKPSGLGEKSRLATVLYTSGSTGNPKGVRLPHAVVLARLSWQWRHLPFNIQEVCCWKTALTFVDAVTEIWSPLLKGVPLVILSKAQVQDPEVLIEKLEEYGVTRLVLVPSLLNSILAAIKAAPRAKNLSLKEQQFRSELIEDLTKLSGYSGGIPRLQHLKLWVCSGEILSKELLLSFFESFPEGRTICNFYGSTEVMGDVTYIAFKNRREAEKLLVDNKVPIGVPLDNCDIYLLNSELKLVAEGEMGEMYVAGAHVASGYVNGREKFRFLPNPIESRSGYETVFRTGDFARLRFVEGFGWLVVFEGRVDSQIKVRGHRIDLSEIESALVKHSNVDKVVVLCYKPGMLEQKIVAFLTVKNELAESDILNYLHTILPAYAMPEIVIVPHIPLLVNGKTDRQSLLLQFETSLENRMNENVVFDLNTVEPNQRPLVTKFMQALTDVVGRPRITSLDVNFFDIGGNSLNAVSMVTKLRDQALFIKVSDFLNSNSLKEIVNSISPDPKNCVSSDSDNEFIVESLTPAMKADAIRIIASSFSERGDLELLTGATYEDFEQLVNQMWPHILSNNLGFALKSATGEVASISFNSDMFKPVPMQMPSKRIAYVFDLIDDTEATIHDKIPHGPNLVLHGQMMGTDSKYSAQENVLLIEKMELEVLRLARQRGFKAVLTTNTSNLTQQLCDEVLGYEILTEYQVQNYVAKDGTRPFIHAPPTQRIVCTIRHLE